MSETNERSGASAGSVAGGPLAWCVISDFYHAPVVSADEEAARRLAKGSDKVLALYPNPPLADAEREAIAWFSHFGRPQNGPVIGKHAATLRGLLERLK